MWNTQNSSSPSEQGPRRGRLTPTLPAADIAVLRLIADTGYLSADQQTRAAYLAAAGFAQAVHGYVTGFILTTYGEIAVQEQG